MERNSTEDEDHRSDGPAAAPAIERRDSGLNLVHRLNRWLIAGAISVAGVLSVAAAQAFHGRTVAHHASDVSSGIQQPSSTAGAFGSAPAPAPAAPSPAVVVSGGS